MTNTIDSNLYLTNYQKAERKTGSSQLGKDDFLKLLMTQLQNQDPSNPMQDTEFIAQMAQFSSLEQMTNMNSTLERFITQQQQSLLISYNQFVGQEVAWHKLSELEDGTAEVKEGSGKVTSIQYKNEKVLFILEDGTKLEPANISQVNATANESNMIQASMMIGKKVTYVNESNEEVSAVIHSVSFRNGKISFQLDDTGNSVITSSQVIKIE
ncbi:flagellar hook assembly protein FlgD [Niallia endozanthoxylica]|uniref:Basal-body rod modification protein FlgD n=1 Tax=Niallia endozanthoxylica TaxID=2036016 RepID=A0A5J5HXP8_9BACI|nr:flagellar hook assembly protein FlgD [Niallia endozanthoxylica]KAA9025872.1 flagellar hook assembly protein FlgD [Niallia endozanthoxylica]